MGVPLLRPRMAGTGAAPARALPILHAAEVGGGGGGEGRSGSSMSKPNEDLTAAKAHEALVVAAQQALELLIGASALTASDVRTALRVALALAEQEASVLVFDAGEDGTEDGPAVRADAEAKEEETTT